MSHCLKNIKIYIAGSDLVFKKEYALNVREYGLV